GGRGGIVIKVTNLNDSGPGSLRDAVENSAYESIPRTIIFDVSGRIELSGRLSVNKPYITIAGQTAPGKGICVSGHAFGIGGVNDVIFRHLRLRVGTDDTTDGMGQSGSNHCIIDHASISWSKDEATSSRDAKNITFQRCLISEPLNRAGHKNYSEGTAHGYAGSIGGDIGSYHHNLLAHSYGRNWSFAGGLDGNGYYKGRLDVFNNVVYNWGTRTTDGGVHEGNFVNNYYKAGAATTFFRMINAQLEGAGKGTQSYYVKGNILQRADGTITCDGTDDACGRTYSLSGGQVLDWQLWVDNPFFPSYATIHTAKEAYKHVLSDVGATQPVFDDHDIRIVQETIEGSWTFRGSYNAPNGTYGVIDHQNDAGGWEDYGNEARPAGYDSDNDGLPDWWEIEVSKTNPHSPAGDFSDANADPDRNGFTNLDDFLDWMGNPHYFISSESKLDLKTLAAGFTATPVFNISEANNCSVNLENGSTAAITPVTGRTSNLGSFTFTVTDSEGTQLTRTVNLYFSGSTGIHSPKAQPLEVKYRYDGKDVLFLSVLSGASAEPTTVSCFDASGRKLFQQNISLSAAGVPVNLSSLAPGIYFVRIATAKEEQTVKIVKTV
ncbi:MAG: T9SS type A sorting domain-containing protein, partial [Dysgonamonadaceae bacterium]|nr:T9SS type A sorting domain-containing protein [Dysgonamonadaceae bacterium]